MTALSMAEALGTRDRGRKTLDLKQTRGLMVRLFGEDLHAQRILSLANGVAGVLSAARLSIHAIGQAYAAVADITPKSGVKQIDRMLSNDGINLDTIFPRWVAFVLGDTERAVLAMDWTDFDDDDHTTLCTYLVSDRGRATPVAWKTVKKSALKGNRTALESQMIADLERWIPPTVKVTLLADRAFGNQDHYVLLAATGWDYVIRFRGCIAVKARGEVRRADEWLQKDGRALLLRHARVTEDGTEIGAVVAVKAPKMKEAWFLATSFDKLPASEIVRLYGRRFTIEETFRDTKDLHFGRGLSSTHIRDPKKRDRMLFLVAAAHALLTLLGAASEAAGLDRILKVNTVKRRTHSLFRQGTYWYSCLPTMREAWLVPLVTAFDKIVRDHVFFADFFGVK